MSRKNDKGPLDPSRRRVLAGLAAAPAAASVLAGCDSGDSADAASGAGGRLPPPEESGIEHIVVVMMENRSFDHILGWLPGADGKQAGLKYPDKNGVMQDTFDLAPEFQGCDFEDPSHSYAGGHTQYNNGKLDGFLQTVGDASVKFPIGYYQGKDLPFYAGAAPAFTTCDRYFSGILSSTFPNRFYMHCGQTDRNTNSFTVSSLPAIWDQLADKGVSRAFYFYDVPITALFGTRFLSITRPYLNFLTACATGTLPAVSFVDPNFGATIGEGAGFSQDDHPFADIRDGQAFLNQVYNAVSTGPGWDKTLLIINYDEWGGFYDHVAPPVGPVSDAEREIGNEDGRLGFRVPCLVIGPRARRGYVDHTVYEPNSILDLIRWRHGITDPLSVRSDKVNNLARALDFKNPPNLSAPQFNVPMGPFGLSCYVPDLPLPGLAPLSPTQESRRQHFAEWNGLRDLAIAQGFIPPLLGGLLK